MNTEVFCLNGFGINFALQSFVYVKGYTGVTPGRSYCNKAKLEKFNNEARWKNRWALLIEFGIMGKNVWSFRCG